MTAHTLNAIKYKEQTPMEKEAKKPREIEDKITESFLSIYNARRRKIELTEKGYVCEIIKLTGEIDKEQKAA